MPDIDFLFEVCFETCNKVGGIYTVVSSKAMLMKEKYGNFIIIGPYYKGKSEEEFEEKDVPENFKSIFEELSNEGIVCHFGTWKIDGEPDTILIDFEGYKGVLDHLKIRYWEEFNVDSLDSGWDFFEPMVWSTAAGKIIEKFQQKNSDKKIIAHFHEWISGFGILLLKLANSPVKTVFTTHATMLGRTMSGNGKNLYGTINEINPKEEAKSLGVLNKYSTEKACAENSDVFTTVSEITGLEAENILERKPDVLVLNGLDLREFDTEDKLVEKKIEVKNMLIDFAGFFLDRKFEKEKTKIIFTSGRYEFKNKGIDILIKSLGKLNFEFQNNPSSFDGEIITFFFVPNAWTKIQNGLEDWSKKVRESDFENYKNNDLSTHELENPDSDPLIKSLKENNLTNQDDSKIKCIVVPIYLSESDGLFNKEYYEITTGCDLSIFASLYEPWGYTPAESLAVGVPTISSDLAGFGRYINSLDIETASVARVIKRYLKDDNDAIEELKNSIREMINTQDDNIVKSCRTISSKMDWREFVKFYDEAYRKAIEK